MELPYAETATDGTAPSPSGPEFEGVDEREQQVTPEGQSSEPSADAAEPQTEAKRVSNWQRLENSRDEWKAKAEEAAPIIDRYREVEPIFDDLVSIGSVLQEPSPGAMHALELERLIYDANPKLWNEFVWRAGQMYLDQIQPQLPQSPTQQNAPAAPAANYQYQGTGFEAAPAYTGGSFQFTDDELADLQVYMPGIVDKAQAAMRLAGSASEAQGIVNELRQQMGELQRQLAERERRDSAQSEQLANDRHDAQFIEEIIQQVSNLGIPRFVDVDGTPQPNPELQAFLKYFNNAFESDRAANAALEASRDAFRNNQRAAIPKLSAAVRSHIGRVISTQVAPLIKPRHEQQMAQSDAARAAASAKPLGSPGGATPPVIGQAGQADLVTRIANIKASTGRRTG